MKISRLQQLKSSVQTKWSRAEKLSLIDTFLGVVLTGLGITITIYLSHKEQSIKDFSELLKKSQKQYEATAQVDSLLLIELSVLEKQLDINEKTQDAASQVAKLKDISNIDHLYYAALDLYKFRDEFRGPTDSLSLVIEPNNVDKCIAILEGQIDNPALFAISNFKVTQNYK